MEKLDQLTQSWEDTPAYHKLVHETFIELVNATPELKAHRDWVEQNIFGFGERSFHWMWWLIIKEMPQEFTFLEIGVFRGQVLSLVRLIADMQGKKVTRYGVTPLSSASNAGENKHWESDYKADIEKMHDQFGIEKDYTILHGLSTDPAIIEQAKYLKIDLMLIDGAHDYDSVLSDLRHYTPLINKDGYLVCDDACNDLKMWFGAFQGIQEVTDAVRDYQKEKDNEPFFYFVGNIVHNRLFKKTM